MYFTQQEMEASQHEVQKLTTEQNKLQQSLSSSKQIQQDQLVAMKSLKAENSKVCW